MCTYTNYMKHRSKVSILNIRQVVGISSGTMHRSKVNIPNISGEVVGSTYSYN